MGVAGQHYSTSYHKDRMTPWKWGCSLTCFIKDRTLATVVKYFSFDA
jgi:hypothetical protein